MRQQVDTLNLEIYQFAPVLGDVESNGSRIADRARATDADILLTPELALTGYDLGDDAIQLAQRITSGQALPETLPLGDARAGVILGLAERGDDGIPYNALAAVTGGVVRFHHRKVYLPTYGMFDEGRFWGRGERVEPWCFGAWTLGLLICEDLWHPALPYVLAATGVHALLVAAAAPGRGPRPDAGGRGKFASMDAWERIARSTAQLYGIYVGLANRVGVEGGVTFAGESMVAGPDGEVLARAAADEECSIRVQLSLEEVARARRPFTHLRDDDLRLAGQLLERAREGR